MAHCRSVLVFVLLALWLAIPALACLPSQQMTAAEMACCKKMAGDCQMRGGRHPCCSTIANTPQPVASMQSRFQIQPSLVVVAQSGIDPVFSVVAPDSVHLGFGLPPLAPPGLHSILRI